MFDQLFNVAIPAIAGAAATGVPLYISLRKAMSEMKSSTEKLNVELQESKAKLEVELQEKRNKNETAHRIDTEAEWMRVINEKNTELVRLRLKDDEQETKLTDLMNKHIDCQKNEARNEEKLKNFGEITKEQSRQIKALTTKLLQLDKLVRGPNAQQQSGSGTHETLLGFQSVTEEEVGNGSGSSIRVPGSTEVSSSIQNESGSTTH